MEYLFDTELLLSTILDSYEALDFAFEALPLSTIDVDDLSRLWQEISSCIIEAEECLDDLCTVGEDTPAKVLLRFFTAPVKQLIKLVDTIHFRSFLEFSYDLCLVSGCK